MILIFCRQIQHVGCAEKCPKGKGILVWDKVYRKNGMGISMATI